MYILQTFDSSRALVKTRDILFYTLLHFYIPTHRQLDRQRVINNSYCKGRLVLYFVYYLNSIMVTK